MVQGWKPLHDGHTDGSADENETKQHVAGHGAADLVAFVVRTLQVAASQIQCSSKVQSFNDYKNKLGTFKVILFQQQWSLINFGYQCHHMVHLILLSSQAKIMIGFSHLP